MAELALEDGRLWYETHDPGRTRGRSLVFVHGGWLNGTAWQPQVEHFADDYRIVTPDVRGHGRTGATDADRYSIELFTDDLEALLAHLEIERPILCGLSLGSMIVQEYLSRHAGAGMDPDSNSSADAAANGTVPAGAILGGAVRSMPPVDLPSGVEPFVSPGPALGTALSLTGPKTTFRSLLQSIRATTGREWLSVDPDVRAAAMDAVGEVSREEFRKVFDALVRYDPPDLSGVDVPTLVVHGEQEAPQVKRQGEQIASAVADGRRVTLENAGHLVNQDRPTAFNAVSEGFLNGLAAEPVAR
ncbi:alpha/beta fold hydrolase [Halopiger xanaduensis]|uniref:Alpha/beta hydrolase fold protein n=1 Tax=Halopiger xanaduensis (strain DSM 18323 / JCM 14033 / SH-6) TaxID=797210 RepID=F8D3M7_HALXS|nr:alpha/beta hydrolase [Halopiger xanaduensis]AEH37392.1 alpha/beta hydrolase fold protein [Halopiger xanaduensis SH-6]